MLKVVRSMNSPTMDYGEVRVVRPAGGGPASVVAKSRVISDFLGRLANGATQEVTFGPHKFTGWIIPDEYFRTLCTPEFSIWGGASLLEDDRSGGINLGFLRHTGLAAGISMELNYPVGLQDYAARLGRGLGQFLEDNLFTMDVGYKFWFEQSHNERD